MVALGISEFTFGFAFLHEQVTNNWGNLVVAPILPSLQQENEQGWDAHLPLNGTDFYYQFKLADYLSRGNATFIRDKTYSGPYYRLALHKKDNNKQHQRLRTLSQVHPNTYYVAPEVNALEDFNTAFLAKQLTLSSRIVPIAQCRDINDGDQHYITFSQGNPGWIEHSDKTIHRESLRGHDLPSLYRKGVDERRRPIGRSFFIDIYESARSVATDILQREDSKLDSKLVPLLNVGARTQSDRGLLVSASELLSAVFGLTLVIVGDSRPDPG